MECFEHYAKFSYVFECIRPLQLFTEFSLKSNFKDTCNLIPINNNLIDEIEKLKKGIQKTEETYAKYFGQSEVA